MTLPSVLFGILIALLLGSLFHFWRGGPLWRLVLYLVLSLAGFWGGHLLGQRMDWSFGTLGALRVGPGVLGALILLAVGHWLSLIQVEGAG